MIPAARDIGRRACIGAASLLVVVGGLARADVVEVRVGEHAAFTRLVAELSAPAAYRVTPLEDPPRLVLDVETAVATGAGGPLASHGLVVGGRVLAPSASSARIEVSLGGAFRVQRVFTLEAVPGHGPRIVADLVADAGAAGGAGAAGSPAVLDDDVVGAPADEAPAAAQTGRRGRFAATRTPGPRADDFDAARSSSEPPVVPEGVRSEWNVNGSVGVRSEYYGVVGNPDFSPYFEEGPQQYVELDVNAQRVVSPFERVRANAFLLGNGSSYREDDRGLLAEQLKLTWEKGDTALPFRTEAGNFFAYQSSRTIRRSLKGLQVELQPRSGVPGRHNSLVLFSGSRSDNYQDLRPDDDLFSGASWQVADRNLGIFTANALHARQRSGSNRDGPVLLQQVVSAAGYRELSALGQRLQVEGEVAHFSGDITRTRQDRSDQAYFAQLLGRDVDSPLSYSLRFDRYGQDFRPREAVVSADRRSLEARAAWQFEEGPQLRGRLQSLRTGLETSNPLDTYTAGLALSGPWETGLGAGATVDADVFVQQEQNRDSSSDALMRSARVAATAPLSDTLTGRIAMLGLSSDDRTPGGGQEISREVEVGVQRYFSFAGQGATLEPAMLLRRVRGAGADRTEYGPSLTLSMWGSSYSLDAWYFHLFQDQHVPGGSDFASDTLGIFATWWKGRHYLQLEANYDRFDTDPGDPTDAYRLALQYTYFFDRPATRLATVRTAIGAAPAPAGGGTLLSLLVPGTYLATVTARLADAGVRGGVERGDSVVYETRSFFPDLDQRQRLVLSHSGGVLDAATVVIGLDDTGGADTVAQLHVRALSSLIDRLGSPDDVVERGVFTPSLAGDLDAGRFLRVADWRTDFGVVRFGIPRRSDREVRMELRIARELPSPRGGRWGAESVR